MTISKKFTVYTGYRDISNILNYITWNGTNTTVFGNKIFGSNDDGQFTPFEFSDHPPKFEVFEPNYQKTIELVPTHNKTSFVKNVRLFRYVLSNSTWTTSPNSSYYNISEPGFAWVGAAFEGIPIYFGNPFFYNADPSWLKKVEGVHPPSHYVEERPLYTIVNIDHRTGKAMWGNQCLQINIFLNSSIIESWFLLDYLAPYSELPQNVMWPVSYIREFAQLSDASANDYIKTFTTIENARNIGLYTSLTIGFILFICGSIATAIGAIQLERVSTYETIN